MLNATPMSRDARQTYLAVTLELQHIYNVQRNVPGTQIVVPVLLAWPVLITAEYVQLLRDLQPQALIIFAHYAVLLHRARNLWIIGDGGQFLIRAISECLGSEWERWLKSPISALQENSISTPPETSMDES